MQLFRLLISVVTIIFFSVGCTQTPSSPATKGESRKNKDDEMAVLSKIKNKNELISALIKLATSNYLETNGFGQMRDFSIDTDAKSFAFSVNLKGESVPLRVAVPKYEIVKEGAKVFFVAKNIATDREWLNAVAVKYLKEKKIEIAPKYSMFMLLAL